MNGRAGASGRWPATHRCRAVFPATVDSNHGGRRKPRAADLWQSGDAALQTDALVVAVFAFAFASAFAAIAGLLAWLRKASFLPFVVYRLVLATILGGLIVIGVLQQ